MAALQCASSSATTDDLIKNPSTLCSAIVDKPTEELMGVNVDYLRQLKETAEALTKKLDSVIVKVTLCN
jgi:hypothetical protein